MESVQKQLIEELNEEGYPWTSINHFYQQGAVLPPNAVDIILKWLPQVYDEHLGVGVILCNSLIMAEQPYDPTTLIYLFDHSDLNDTVKQSIGHVLCVSKTYDITDWVVKQLLFEEHSFKRAGLLSGILTKCSLKDRTALLNFLKAVFDRYAYYEVVQKLFQKYGSLDDVPFLEQKLSTIENKKTARQVAKVIEKLKTKKRFAKFP